MSTFNNADFLAKLENCEHFVDYVKSFKEDMTREISSLLPNTDEAQLNHYLYDPLRENASNFGKCTRPLTCLLGCALFSGDVEKAVKSACAIEMFQTAALIHDDIADNAKTRRSKPCLHVTQGLNIALNAGDFALCLVDKIVLSDENLDSETKIEVQKQIFDMKAKTIEGQALDLGWARDDTYDINIDDYIFMATRKTAHYTIAKPLIIGAIIAGAGNDKIKKLDAFGQKIGLAFQIQDDILNVDVKGEKSAKDFALDITEGKRTMILIHALKNLKKNARLELLGIISEHTPDKTKLNRALELLESAGSIEFAKDYARTLADESKEILCASLSECKARDILISMCNWCIERVA